MKVNRLFSVLGIGAFLSLAGCGGGDANAGTVPGGTATGAASAAAAGEVHEVRMVSGRGELFEPADLTVKAGDVVRFVLVAGVHNASFPAHLNPSGANLPAATPYLQAPGQTHDMVVDLPPGEYHYQCDPHAALGMVGTLTVTN